MKRLFSFMALMALAVMLALPAQADMTATESPAAKLRRLIAEHEGPLVMPCCFDVLSARLIEGAEFPLTFMSGFAVAAAHLGLPDTGLISYGEMVDQGCNICAAVDSPVIGDGDTGYGNAVNAKRSLRESLEDMRAGRHPHDRLLDFADLRQIVGFEDYYAEDAR